MDEGSSGGSPHDVLHQIADVLSGDLRKQGYEVDIVVSRLVDEEGLLDCLFFPGMPESFPLLREMFDGNFVHSKWAACHEVARERAPYGLAPSWQYAQVDGEDGFTLVYAPLSE